MDINHKPTEKELDERTERLVQLNDPAKGGSEYLQRKVQDANKRIKDGLATNAEFPAGENETKTEPVH